MMCDDFLPKAVRLERFRSYFETDRIRIDVGVLSQLFTSLAFESLTNSDADESIRMMKYYFQLEKGKTPHREITMAAEGPVSHRFAGNASIISEIASVYEEVEWIREFDASINDFDWVRSLYSDAISNQTVRNIQRTVTHVLNNLDEFTVTEGFLQSVYLPLEFIRYRDQRMRLY